MKKFSMLALFVSSLVSLLPSNRHVEASATIWMKMSGQYVPNANEKRTRTVAQQKIDSHLLMAARLKRQGVPMAAADVECDDTGRAAVDISAEVTDNLLETIQREGGKVLSSSPHFKAVRAYLTLESLEAIAVLNEVRVISRAATPELSVNEPVKETENPNQSKPDVKQTGPRTSRVFRTQSRRRKLHRHTRRHQQRVRG